MEFMAQLISCADLVRIFACIKDFRLFGQRGKWPDKRCFSVSPIRDSLYELIRGRMLSHSVGHLDCQFLRRQLALELVQTLLLCECQHQSIPRHGQAW